MGGRMSAEQAHAKWAFPTEARCICGRKPLVRAIVMLPLDEVRKRDPEFDRVVQLASVNPAAAQQFFSILVQLKGIDGNPEPHIRISTTYACETCAPTMERVLAKGPSYAVVEINRGPGPDKIISSG